MIEIKLLLDYDEGPIWPNLSNPLTFEKSSGVEIIDNDKKIIELSKKMSAMYDSYYNFDNVNSSCGFNEKKFRKEKNIMLDLLQKLKDRLNEINDGSFIVVDEITNMYTDQ